MIGQSLILSSMFSTKEIRLIKLLLSDEVQAFIEKHYHDDPRELLLKYRSVGDAPASLVADQITGRKKAEDKLATWYREKRIVYPPSLNIEQASSEKTALTKINLLKKELGPDLAGKTLLDLTGGFGVDSFFFSRHFKEVHFVEPDSRLIEISRHNHTVLGAANIHYFNIPAEAFLTSTGIREFDVIYIDPSRRVKGDKKVFSLGQCEPSVVTLQPKIWEKTNHLLLKSSPLLDIQVGLGELLSVKTLCITSVRNECKELIFFCKENFKSEPVITAINVDGKEDVFSFLISDERKAQIQFSDPLEYIYEPNASLLKSGAFKTLGVAFNIPKLHPNTHLYTSATLIEEFPGRIFQIEAIAKSGRKKLMDYFESGSANIITRNYPLSVDEIRKRSRLKDGGDKFLIGCSGLQQKFLLVGRKLK